MWLLAIGVASCWCGLFASWSELYWKGQQTRLTETLPEATEFVQSLRFDWPIQDGTIKGIGMFLAYPKSAPSTLLMIGESRVPKTLLRFSAIEQTADGALRLELAGAENGAWLEWRPDGSIPESFVGGLQTTYTIVKSARLTENWIAVRYETSIR